MEQCHGMDTFSLSSIHFYVLVQLWMAQLCSTSVIIILKMHWLFYLSWKIILNVLRLFLLLFDVPGTIGDTMKETNISVTIKH